MVSVGVILIALVPVLVVGTVFIELLIREAPRLGKRPDVGGYVPERSVRVEVVAPDGSQLSGRPAAVVATLARRGFAGASPWLTDTEALRLLDSWSALGRIQLAPRWH